MIIKKSSWHYRFISTFRPSGLRDVDNTCLYVWYFIGTCVFALVSLYMLMIVVLFILIPYFVAYQYYFTDLDVSKGNLIWAITFFIFQLVILAIFFVFSFIKDKELKNSVKKEPSKMKVFYMNWKEKTCERLTFED